MIFKRNHSPLIDHYGAPDALPAIKTIHADDAARDFNIDFFENNAVPRLAIIVEGGELTDAARNSIYELMHEDLKEGDHRTLILEVEKVLDDPEAINIDGNREDLRIRVEPITVGVEEDASFLDFRKYNEHDILKVHEVPPIEAGTIESGAFSTDAEAQRKGYLETVIKPKQQAFAQLLYETVHAALGITDWTIQFQTRGVDERQAEAEIADLRIRMGRLSGTMTVDEARAEMGLDPLEGVVGDMTIQEFQADMGGGGGGAVGSLEETIDQLVTDRVDDLTDDVLAQARTEARLHTGATADD